MQDIPPTDLDELTAYLRDLPYRSALPPALPDHWLRPIVRDLRAVESAHATTDPSDHSNMSGPLAITIHIVLGRLTECGANDPVAYNEQDVVRWFAIYQSFAERELATRILGLPVVNLEDKFLSALDKEIGLPQS